jgi:superfamily II DNA or RNA helicase
MVDECHHLVAPKIREAVINANCYYKIGFSATPFVSTRSESEQSGIWLKAATGAIRFRLSHSELAAKGFVLMPKIYLVEVKMAKGTSSDFSERIVNDPNRNLEILRVMVEFYKQGKPSAVITSRLSHMMEICRRAEQIGMKAKPIHGGTSMDDRMRWLKKLANGEIDFVVGTVINEAVDIPKLEGVIIAEGLKSRIRAIQRLRNLTVSEGKGEPIVVDFFDMDGSILERHSQQRLEAYRKAGFEPVTKKSASLIFESEV